VASFITTIKFTPQGVTNIKDTCKRAAAFIGGGEEAGGQGHGPILNEGAFDGLLIFEAANDKTASALTLHLASQGFVHMQTARAFAAAEIE
jgi:uncharacterized protein with GYD domain